MKSLKLISSAITMLICFVTMAQERTITGIVSDETQMPIPGAIITNKTSKAKYITSFDGKYSIKAKKGDLLIFEYIGYHSQRQKVEDSNLINIKLVPAFQTLQEVVAVGYETTKTKRKMTTASSTRMVQGTVAGVQISSNSQYMPSPSITAVKEYPSNASKNEPIYIVDGVAIKADQMAKINPNDINDIKVLKDEAATSLYGSKAANGAIVLVTKNEIYKNLSESEVDSKLSKVSPIRPAEPAQEDYDAFVENAFESPKTAPLSTFSIDVDNASYTNVRRFINTDKKFLKMLCV